ncbi:MAG: ABC transporter permease [Jatrophihabitans sp.]
MTEFLTFTLAGLVLGAVYGIAASGLVLTYNTSGIFNFAHGAEAMFGAFVYWQVHVSWGLPTWLALIVVIGIFAPLMGGALYFVIMRGLRNTAEVTKIVVTVAVLLGSVALSQWIWDPLTPRSIDLFFGPTKKVEIFGAFLSYHDIITLFVAVLIIVGIWLLFYKTMVGVAMRGVVDDPALLQLNGHDPQRTSALSWILGAMLAVIAGVLITPISGGSLDANALTLLVIDTFAAAMFGRLRSIPRTFVGAIVLGLASNYVVGYFPSDWSWTPNFRLSLSMIVLFVVLIVVPSGRLTASATRTRERYRVPTLRMALIGAVALIVTVVLIRQLMVVEDITQLALGMTFAVMALSLTLLTGYAGQPNLGVVSFGAVATVLVFHNGLTGYRVSDTMTWWGLLIAVAITAVVGALVALPALRLQGLYLALATIAFGVFISRMVLADIGPHKLFGMKFSLFTQGSLTIPALKVGPLDLRDPTTFLMSVTVVFAVLGVALIALRNSGYGRRLAAMKDSPVALSMLGQNLIGLKLGVFALSAAIAGLGGILMSTALGTVNVGNFDILLSLSLVMLTVSAGIGYVTGALAGGVLAGVGFAVLVGTFNNLGTSNPGSASTYSALASFITVLPAVIGITIGRSPSGFLHELFEGYRRLLNAKPVLIGGALVEALMYVLALTDTLDNWWFGITTFALLFLLPVFGQVFMPAAMRAPHESVAEPDPIWEDVGITTPYTLDLRTELDRRLGLPAPATELATRRPSAVAAGSRGV